MSLLTIVMWKYTKEYLKIKGIYVSTLMYVIFPYM